MLFLLSKKLSEGKTLLSLNFWSVFLITRRKLLRVIRTVPANALFIQWYFVSPTTAVNLVRYF